MNGLPCRHTIRFRISVLRISVNMCIQFANEIATNLFVISMFASVCNIISPTDWAKIRQNVIQITLLWHKLAVIIQIIETSFESCLKRLIDFAQISNVFSLTDRPIVWLTVFMVWRGALCACVCMCECACVFVCAVAVLCFLKYVGNSVSLFSSHQPIELTHPNGSGARFINSTQKRGFFVRNW